MGWDGIGCMGWGGVGWDGVGWDGMDGMDGMGCGGMGWDGVGVGWGGMEWDGMGWMEWGGGTSGLRHSGGGDECPPVTPNQRSGFPGTWECISLTMRPAGFRSWDKWHGAGSHPISPTGAFAGEAKSVMPLSRGGRGGGRLGFTWEQAPGQGAFLQLAQMWCHVPRVPGGAGQGLRPPLLPLAVPGCGCW